MRVRGSMMKRLYSIFAAFMIIAAAGPVSGSETEYKVLVLGDLHYAAPEFYPKPHPRKQNQIDECIGMWKHSSVDLLHAAGKCAAAERPAFVLQLGDLTNGLCENPADHEKMLRSSFRLVKTFFPKIPLYGVIGNRDIQQQKGDSFIPAEKALYPLIAGELGRKNLENGNYAFTRGPDLFIGVNSMAARGCCLDFIRKTLSEHPKTRYVFLLTHCPVFPASFVSYLGLIPDYDEIARLLETRNALVLAADTHVFSFISRVTSKGKLSQIIFTSMGNDWNCHPLLSRFFGNHLKIRSDWEEYVRTFRSRLIRKQVSVQLRQNFENIVRQGKFSASFFARKSGFAVLRVNDRKAIVEIHIDDSGNPAQTLTVLENR